MDSKKVAYDLPLRDSNNEESDNRNLDPKEIEGNASKEEPEKEKNVFLTSDEILTQF